MYPSGVTSSTTPYRDMHTPRHTEGVWSGNVLPRAFYDRDPVTVAQALLGTQLIREDADGVVTGLIIETEAYLAAQDPASHAIANAGTAIGSPRCAPMFGPQGTPTCIAVMAGTTAVTSSRKAQGVPSAVLLRAVQPE